jgi:site-specific DNA-methyltransferase (adenine-specific)
MAWEVEHIGACTLYRADCRDVLPGLPPVESLITDPPYGLGLTGKAGRYRHAPRAKRAETYRGYADTLENFETIIVPSLQQALTLASCGLVFMAGLHIFKLPPGELGAFYLPSGCGSMAWGFQNFIHFVLYGHDPYLATGQGRRPNGKYGLWVNDANGIAHPCAKPLAAMQWAVHRASLPGYTVLDPFMGSGTTGVACVQQGRAFLGIEIERQYFDVACARLTHAVAQPDLFLAQPLPPKQLALEIL